MYQLTFILLCVLTLISCRGQITETRPIHLNPNMDMQSKYKAQKLSKKIPDNTVAWGRFSVTIKDPKRADFLREEEDVYSGTLQTSKGENTFVKSIPSKYKVDETFVLRGQEKFNIYCAICHDKVGTGQGTVSKRGIGVVPNFHEAKFVDMADGEIFNTISKGKGTMPAYDRQLEVDDRWAIVSYIRALQNLNIK